ncbi:class I SAM-dependent rRNA methyltransferase [Peloplasma aerotolerans]|uniref:Class I SAM-dependent rRNA methyltransferase n=1 Tax=Peloplasma aerotolerans TaxID=3044389 RepID=A0AAW6UCT7_9MOLU|nr:class I SAM-dependent rRNA methyltransferase [Mariniplasma sp. M4Ah]MDI6453459.1 class I SAM-dependent rRNA methyltransferase [Mariniplasma sp. M4Ah]MDR4968642.1 class I SAM-dependent rRNA methyltransferase [Acholeplasmataceae bacterium]
MDTCKIYLKPTEEIRINQGHPWVFNNEIDRIEGTIKSGELASVFSSKNEFVGKGFLNTSSKIFVRILSRNLDEIIDESFFKNLVETSNNSRKSLGYSNSYRVLFGESDGIPGLIIDKYGDYLSVQILSLGIDQRKDMFIKILVDIFNPKGIYERSDVSVRKKEGLELFKGVIYGDVPSSVIIKENELNMEIDIINGQKTGSFLDQQDNHKALKPYVKNKTVLDCFSHIGGFGLHAAYYGAKLVTCLDISEHAVTQIEKNARLNQLDQVKASKANVFEQLRLYDTNKETFDVVILDPPAFAKKNDDIKKAYKGYKDINLSALKIINPDGYLMTCSCSHYMSPSLFLEMLMDAAYDAKRITQLVEFRIQGKDHPALLGSDESLYLKCVVLRVK